MPASHDEDGDGVDDACDVCPHISDNQADADFDGVGDACDPEPSMPRQQLSWFAPMAADTPCQFFPANAWTMTGDAWTVTGAMTQLVCRAFPIRDTDIWIGVDITAVNGLPHQFAVDVKDSAQATYYYGDVYDDGFPVAAISQYDGASFVTLQSLPLPGIHPGAFTDHLATRTAGTGTEKFTLEIGWPGEPYMLFGLTPGFAGTDGFILSIQHLDLTIRYVAFVDTVP